MWQVEVEVVWEMFFVCSWVGGVVVQLLRCSILRMMGVGEGVLLIMWFFGW